MQRWGQRTECRQRLRCDVASARVLPTLRRMQSALGFAWHKELHGKPLNRQIIRNWKVNWDIVICPDGIGYKSVGKWFWYEIGIAQIIITRTFWLSVHFGCFASRESPDLPRNVHSTDESAVKLKRSRTTVFNWFFSIAAPRSTSFSL